MRLRVATGLVSVVASLLLGGCAGDEERLFVGVVDDAARSGDPAAFVAELAESGFDALAVSSTWDPGETAPDDAEVETLRAVASAADDEDVRLFVLVYHPGSATTPLTPEARAAFARYAAAVATEVDGVRDLIVGNEPNLNRFWLPQFGANGEIVSAAGYLELLAETYDAVKAARDDVRIWGGATAPRGADRPDAPRATTSPTAFIRGLGEAYRRSGRGRPVMDGFVHHPYAESARVPVDLPHPNVTTIGLADYGKLVGLLREAFDGTAQAGSELPILYGEFGVETEIPPVKTPLYTGEEPVATVSEQAQAAAYRRALELVVCQPRVVGMLVFHLRDEPALTGWQSGVRYADGTPKESLRPVRDAVRAAREGELDGRCGR
ncbi:MAG TPA: hypothetical protein VK874_02020 [Gaiellaceae bacterium]|nr:hypothetical protein [Gaiellaceae bacterium]